MTLGAPTAFCKNFSKRFSERVTFYALLPVEEQITKLHIMKICTYINLIDTDLPHSYLHVQEHLECFMYEVQMKKIIA